PPNYVAPTPPYRHPTDRSEQLVKRYKELVPALVEAMKDTDPNVRATAAAVLGSLGKDATGNKELVPTLVAALNDSNFEVRQMAAMALAATGKESVPALQEALRDKDKELRANAAHVIGQLGSSAQETVPSLVASLKKEQDGMVRRQIVFALHQVVRK